MKRTMLGALLMGVLFSGPAFAQVSDTTPPAVVAFDFTPKSVNVSAGPATVTVTLRITDDLAGFGLPPQIGPSVGFRGPGTGGASCGGHTLIEGTDRDQVWSCTVTMPQFAEPGVWQAVVNLSDLVGNNKFYEPQDLQALGFPTQLSVASTPDTTPPAVVAFDFTPKSVDVSAGPATVTVTLRITDDLAGFGLPPQIGPSVGFRGPGTGGASCGGHTLIEGTDRDQVWSCTVTIPQFAQPGVWQAVVNLSDLVGNNKFYEPQDLQAAGFPVDLRVGVPAISINNVTLIEGGFGVRNADFMVTLSFPSTQTVTMNYVTAAGTARAWIDYVPRAGTLTFLPGTTTKKVTILVWGERLFEPDETFFVNLSGAINGSILDGQGLGTILNDDPRKSPGR